ncbi:MAG: SAM-dependent methyltransferase, partial [Cyanobacteria bacterium P01_G01_bin.49]
DQTLLASIPQPHPCMYGWPSKNFLNYDYQPVKLSDIEYNFMEACNGKSTVKKILSTVPLELEEVRSLQQKQLIILNPEESSQKY